MFVGLSLLRVCFFPGKTNHYVRTISRDKRSRERAAKGQVVKLAEHVWQQTEILIFMVVTRVNSLQFLARSTIQGRHFSH